MIPTTILIMEGELTGPVLSAFLEGEGFEVHLVERREELADELTVVGPDLLAIAIDTDADLALAGEMRELSPDTPIVAMNGAGRPQLDIGDARVRYGIGAQVQKPFRFVELLRAARDLLGRADDAESWAASEAAFTEASRTGSINALIDPLPTRGADAEPDFSVDGSLSSLDANSLFEDIDAADEMSLDISKFELRTPMPVPARGGAGSGAPLDLAELLEPPDEEAMALELDSPEADASDVRAQAVESSSSAIEEAEPVPDAQAPPEPPVEPAPEPPARSSVTGDLPPPPPPPGLEVDAPLVAPEASLQSERASLGTVEPAAVEPAAVEPPSAEPAAESLERRRPATSTPPPGAPPFVLVPIEADGPTAPQGIYGPITVPELVYRVFRDLFSGRVVLVRGPQRRELIVQNGRPIGVDVVRRNESLGELLLAEGRISPAAAAGSLEAGPHGGLDQGEALVAAGAIERSELGEWVRRQVRLLVLDTYRWSWGHYGLAYDPAVAQRAGAWHSDPFKLVFEGLRQNFPDDLVRAHFADRRRHYCEATPRYRDRAALLKQFPEVPAVADRCDGVRTPEEVVRGSGVDAALAWRALWGLEIIEGLRFHEEPVQQAKASQAVRIRRTTGNVRSTRVPAAVSQKSSVLERAISRARRTASKDDFYQRLRVPTTATTEVIAANYNMLARPLSPERLRSLTDDEKRTTAEEAYRRLTEAYEVLSNPDTRSAYDREMRSGAAGAGGGVAFHKGRAALQSGDTQKALELFEVAYAEAPTEAQYRMYVGWARFLAADAEDKETRRAAHDLIKGAVLDAPDHDEGYLLFGYVYQSNGDIEKAEKLFSKALAMNPGNAEARRALKLVRSRSERDKGLLGRFFKK